MEDEAEVGMDQQANETGQTGHAECALVGMPFTVLFETQAQDTADAECGHQGQDQHESNQAIVGGGLQPFVVDEFWFSNMIAMGWQTPMLKAFPAKTLAPAT